MEAVFPRMRDSAWLAAATTSAKVKSPDRGTIKGALLQASSSIEPALGNSTLRRVNFSKFLNVGNFSDSEGSDTHGGADESKSVIN
jgi:hypothetical protein